MKAVILVVFVLTVAAVLCLLEAYREQQYFKVTEDVVVSRRLNGLKRKEDCVLSDLHNKEYGAGNERLLDAICKARPDLILIGGDMLVGKKGCSFAPALEFVSKTSCDRSGVLCLRKSRAADEKKTGSLWGGLSGVSKAIRRMWRAFSGK